MPDQLSRMTDRLPGGLDQIVYALVVAAIGIGLAVLAHALAFRLMRRVTVASESEVDDMVVARLARPSRYAMIALGLVLGARETPLLADVWEKVAGLVMPALVGWIALTMLRAFIDATILRTDITAADNRNARRKRTRLTIFSRIGTFVIMFVTIGMMLLSIPGIRQVGVTLMASAGIAALAVGAAAQPALKALVSGFQMALTEPVAIDDVIIIEGQWGRVEDIRTTYVVVRTWDERRLIVPTAKFLEETFENWTRSGAELLAPVLLYLDPMTEIAPLRTEFERQVKAHPLWDGRTVKLQVTEAREQSIEVRLLMSACDSGSAFDLRCDIRESVLEWLRRNQPAAMPRRRVEAVEAEPADAAG